MLENSNKNINPLSDSIKDKEKSLELENVKNAAKINPPNESNPKSPNELQMISQDKSYIRHRFDDFDDKGNIICKFQCQTYWAKQFLAVRSCYFKEFESDENYIRSLSMSSRWTAQGLYCF
jgi:hypothetical protein